MTLHNHSTPRKVPSPPPHPPLLLALGYSSHRRQQLLLLFLQEKGRCEGGGENKTDLLGEEGQIQALPTPCFQRPPSSPFFPERQTSLSSVSSSNGVNSSIQSSGGGGWPEAAEAIALCVTEEAAAMRAAATGGGGAYNPALAVANQGGGRGEGLTTSLNTTTRLGRGVMIAGPSAGKGSSSSNGVSPACQTMISSSRPLPLFFSQQHAGGSGDVTTTTTATGQPGGGRAALLGPQFGRTRKLGKGSEARRRSASSGGGGFFLNAFSGFSQPN